MNARTLVTTILIGALVFGGSFVLSGCGGDRPQVPSATDSDSSRDGVATAARLPVAREGPQTQPADPPTAAAQGAPEDDAPEDDTSEIAPESDPSGRAPMAARPEPEDSSVGAERTGAEQRPSSDSILRATSRAYEDVRSIRATFEQRLENPLLGRTTRSSGVIYQRQPDRFLMEFSDPAGDIIVSDGAYFWMWYPSVDSTQVLRTRRAGTGLDLRSQFIGDPVERFESTYHGTEPVRGRTTHVFTLVPREPAGYTRLKAWIDAEDHLVRRFELAESSGNVRHFELTDLAVNPTLPTDLFQFTPPPGARVVTR